MSEHSRDRKEPRMTGFDSSEDGFGAAVVRALERPPVVDVPAAFASRVTGLALAQPARPRSAWAGFGPRIALASGVLMLVALFVFTGYATPSLSNPSFSNPRFDFELLLLVELGAMSLLVPHLASRE